MADPIGARALPAAGDTQTARDEAMTRKLQNMGRHGVTPEKAKEVGREFEAMFLSQMLAPMFDTVKTDGMFGGGHGEDSFKGLLVDEYAKNMARQGSLGIADMISKQVMEYAQGQSDAKLTVADAAAAYRNQSGSGVAKYVQKDAPADAVPVAPALDDEPKPVAAPREAVSRQNLRAPTASRHIDEA
ncbi:rod-binding protein [Lacibacterium aquatile]|uniref:Rod-binding protein n=1 Tax=Lacibacterium aquatile TaxID=1168082 RepID=A0ABW5DMI3_9PROT